MFLIDCPWCGPRAHVEFTCKGQAHIARPTDTESLSDEEWGNYVFYRDNPKGIHYERWIHSHGCRRWFNVARDTVTDRILAVYKVDEERPSEEELKEAAAAIEAKINPGVSA